MIEMMTQHEVTTSPWNNDAIQPKSLNDIKQMQPQLRYLKYIITNR